jgi:hypothetical protein
VADLDGLAAPQIVHGHDVARPSRLQQAPRRNGMCLLKGEQDFF